MSERATSPFLLVDAITAFLKNGASDIIRRMGVPVLQARRPVHPSFSKEHSVMAGYIYFVQLDIPEELEEGLQPDLRRRACAEPFDGSWRPRLHTLSPGVG